MQPEDNRRAREREREHLVQLPYATCAPSALMDRANGTQLPSVFILPTTDRDSSLPCLSFHSRLFSM